ncbi:MAG: hypothetical protein U0457_13830 [Candidatus Sericytochromatia bacterium]
MFGKLFKSISSKSSKSDDFMQNISSTKKETNHLKELINEKKKELNIKTCVSNDFINMINEAKKDSDIKHNLSKDEKFDDVFNQGLQAISEFSENPNDKDKLTNALDLFSEAISIKRNRAEPYYFFAYICYLLNDINLAEKYFKISSYLNPEQKYLMSLGRKITNKKMLKRG